MEAIIRVEKFDKLGAKRIVEGLMAIGMIVMCCCQSPNLKSSGRKR